MKQRHCLYCGDELAETNHSKYCSAQCLRNNHRKKKMEEAR